MEDFGRVGWLMGSDRTAINALRHLRLGHPTVCRTGCTASIGDQRLTASKVRTRQPP